MPKLQQLSDRELLRRMMHLERKGDMPRLQRLYAEEDRRGGEGALYARIERQERLFKLWVPSDHKYERGGQL